MATRERARDRGVAQANNSLGALGTEIRTARVGAGLSLRATGMAVGLDASKLSRLERGLLPEVSLRDIALACAAVGLKLVVRAYPATDPVRDAGHLRLLSRLRARLPVGAPWQTEVPIPIPGDRRAIDAVTRMMGRSVGFEAETRLSDVQALGRRVQLKKRDADLEVLVLVVADTPHNRRVLEIHADAFRAAFPLETRQALHSLGLGKAPSADAIVVI